jgi:hypothetical protein
VSFGGLEKYNLVGQLIITTRLTSEFIKKTQFNGRDYTADLL